MHWSGCNRPPSAPAWRPRRLPVTFCISSTAGCNIMHYPINIFILLCLTQSVPIAWCNNSLLTVGCTILSWRQAVPICCISRLYYSVPVAGCTNLLYQQAVLFCSGGRLYQSVVSAGCTILFRWQAVPICCISRLYHSVLAAHCTIPDLAAGCTILFWQLAVAFGTGSRLYKLFCTSSRQ